MEKIYWHKLSSDETIKKLKSSLEGLNDEEVKKRISEFGYNKLPDLQSKTLLQIFFRQFLSPLIYLLLIAGVIAFFVKDHKDAFFIFAVILLNAILGTWQEHKAESNASALRKMVKIKTRVKRNGKITSIDAVQLVPGDYVLLESGSKVPADIRLINVKDLQIEEALLTGESLASEKQTKPQEEENIPIGDRKNMAFAGTTVVKGRGEGIVVGTALQTELGLISQSLKDTENVNPPLIERMDKFSKKIGIIIVVACVILGFIGYSKGLEAIDILFVMVALGVSAIPEGLPIALTVALSIGTSRMAKKNVIIRKLPAVEGLGSCTAIASDKTGTLTVDEQTLRTILLANGVLVQVKGQGYNGEGEIESLENQESQKYLQSFIQIATLANEATLRKRENGWEYSGDPVDVAFLALSYKSGSNPELIANEVKVLKLIPYESENKFSGVYFEQQNEKIIAIKGASEVISQYLSDEQKNFVKTQSDRLATKGYRVLALAKGLASEDLSFNKSQKLELIGLAGLIDPLRPEARDAVKECHKAGITVMMVTGDHPLTALAISRELGIANDESELITGAELYEFGTDAEKFTPAIKGKKVFARVSPIQKKAIVDALKLNGHYVAVTGDGANDAPALKSAHIGVAMGSGTDISKDTASIIITDDNFASIVSGIKEGRITYNNLRKIIFLLVSTGMSEIILIALPLLIGLPLPFSAVQLLWLNLVTNGIQDKGLAFEKGNPNIMSQKPRKPNEPIFDRKMIEQIVVSALTMSLTAFAAWYLMLYHWGIDEFHSRTLLMALYVFFQNFHALNCRSETRSVFKIPISSNYLLVFSIVFAQLLHIAATYFPFSASILSLDSISFQEWIILLPTASIILIVMEVYKKLRPI